jgi:hypothetical protein
MLNAGEAATRFDVVLFALEITDFVARSDAT